MATTTVGNTTGTHHNRTRFNKSVYWAIGAIVAVLAILLFVSNRTAQRQDMAAPATMSEPMTDTSVPAANQGVNPTDPAMGTTGPGVNQGTGQGTGTSTSPGVNQ